MPDASDSTTYNIGGKSRIKIAVLSSGGIDSTVLSLKLALEGKEVHPVFIKVGHPWEEAELWALRKISKVFAERQSGNPDSIQSPKVLSLPMDDVYSHGSWSLNGENVPSYHTPDTAVEITGRNIVLLSKTAVYCALKGISAIALGSLSGNPFSDATAEFFSAGTAWFGIGLKKKVEVLTPLREISKAQVIRLGRELGVPLELTMSCINPRLTPKDEFVHCGNCNKCAERQHAFAMAAVEDKTSYL